VCYVSQSRVYDRLQKAIIADIENSSTSTGRYSIFTKQSNSPLTSQLLMPDFHFFFAELPYTPIKKFSY
jgi:hypothetical protein